MYENFSASFMVRCVFSVLFSLRCVGTFREHNCMKFVTIFGARELISRISFKKYVTFNC